MLTKTSIGNIRVCTTWELFTVLANMLFGVLRTKYYSINFSIVNNDDRKINEFQPNILTIGVTNVQKPSEAKPNSLILTMR